MGAIPQFGVGFFLKSYSPFYTHLDSFLSLESRPLNFRVFINAYSLRPVVANTRTKSIQTCFYSLHGLFLLFLELLKL